MAGRTPFVAADALVLKVREDGRLVNVHAQIAVGVNAVGVARATAKSLASTSRRPRDDTAQRAIRCCTI